MPSGTRKQEITGTYFLVGNTRHHRCEKQKRGTLSKLAYLFSVEGTADI